MKRLPADEKRHFCYTSAVKVAFNFCYTSVLKVPSSSIKLQKAFSVQRELLHGFARDLRESARATNVAFSNKNEPRVRHTAVKRLPADEKRHFCYTSAVKVAFNVCSPNSACA